MADARRDIDADGDNGGAAGPESHRSTGLAPWQKVVGIIGLLVILLIIISLVVGGGHTSPVQHGMGPA